MGHLYVLLGLGVLVLLAFGLSLHRRFGRRYRLPYVVDQFLFSPDQRAFLTVLERALGKDYRVYGRVRAADVIGLRPRLDRDCRRRAYARLGDRQFDFLVCAAGTGAIACAVNLSPRSRLGRRPPRDTLDRICAAAGLPLVRFRVGESYSVVEIEERVFAAMQVTQPQPAAARRAPEPPRREVDAVLHGLSAVLVEDNREPRLRAMPAPKATPAAAARDIPAGPAVPQAAAAPRLEPTLAAQADLDLGPDFTLDGDLGDGDERPARLRRARSP